MSGGVRIRISLPAQSLELRDARGSLLRRYAVSTARSGAGEQTGSFRTPRGRHIVRAKVGAGATANTVFRGRRPTGEIWTPELGAEFPGRDWILTRILWLSGKQPGRNRLGDVDTMRRYIYIHGSPDIVAMGSPGSIGCVRMRNIDIIELFDLVPPYTRVDIDEFSIGSGDWAELCGPAAAIREEVFVREQSVPAALEIDGHDPDCQHVLARDPAGNPIGTGRLLPDGHIGRMAVRGDWRGQGVGAAMLEALLDAAQRAGKNLLALNSQETACGFYRRFGFIETGPVFMEAGIPHCEMRRTA